MWGLLCAYLSNYLQYLYLDISHGVLRQLPTAFKTYSNPFSWLIRVPLDKFNTPHPKPAVFHNQTRVKMEMRRGCITEVSGDEKFEFCINAFRQRNLMSFARKKLDRLFCPGKVWHIVLGETPQIGAVCDNKGWLMPAVRGITNWGCHRSLFTCHWWNITGWVFWTQYFTIVLIMKNESREREREGFDSKAARNFVITRKSFDSLSLSIQNFACQPLRRYTRKSD